MSAEKIMKQVDKDAYAKDIQRSIRNGKRRFISLLLIVALGVMMFSALKSACEDLRYSADHFFDQQNLRDIEIVSTEELFNKKKNISKYTDINEDDEYGHSISGKRKYNFTLKDTMEPQILKFDSPIDLYNMKIIIKSVYPGAKYKDTAISEISFR